VQCFNATLSPWDGQPTSPPALKASRAGTGAVSLAASWNGATRVASWRVLSGSSPATLSPLTTSPRRGFETTITARASDPYPAAPPGHQRRGVAQRLARGPAGALFAGRRRELHPRARVPRGRAGHGAGPRATGARDEQRARSLCDRQRGRDQHDAGEDPPRPP